MIAKSLLIGVELHSVLGHDSLHRSRLKDPGLPHDVDFFELVLQFESPTQIGTLLTETSVRVILQLDLAEGGQVHFCQHLHIQNEVLAWITHSSPKNSVERAGQCIFLNSDALLILFSLQLSILRLGK